MILKNENGFIALTSAVVVAALLLVISFSLGMTGFFARFNILELEYKERSLALAEGCVESARLKLVANPNYDATGELPIRIGNFNCEIISVDPLVSPIVVRTRAEFPQDSSVSERAVTNLVVEVNDDATLSIESWEEVANHTP